VFLFLVFLFVLLFVVTLIFAATNIYASNDIPVKKTERFLKTVMKGDIDKAYDNMFAGTALAEFQPAQIQFLKNQTKSGLLLYGEILGYEVIHNEQLSPSLTRVVYLLKQEKNATVWFFYYYKATDKWSPVQISFNDQYQGIGSLK